MSDENTTAVNVVAYQFVSMVASVTTAVIVVAPPFASTTSSAATAVRAVAHQFASICGIVVLVKIALVRQFANTGAVQVTARSVGVPPTVNMGVNALNVVSATQQVTSVPSYPVVSFTLLKLKKTVNHSNISVDLSLNSERIFRHSSLRG